ncbi:Pentatricopeptide repeat-containing protein [Striga hermonthica]|uniref:Pentatricopeptide repeat-containing protein n=1 Tax=Striga hermonthica TaxID=68872 RepID=A0A9N7RGI5_STRHE|nr:Pentatricopeptide repeat-containing protein [Striga hermonthica]
MRHGRIWRKIALLHNPLAFLIVPFSSKFRFTTAAKAPASSLGDLLLVASIAKTLSKPGGIHTLDRDGDSIPLSEELVLQILRRGSLDASRKLDFFRWCSLRHNYKHSAGAYSQMFRSICFLPNRHYNDILELLASMRRDGLTLDSSTLKLILDGFIRSGKYDSALEVLDYVERELIDKKRLSPDAYSPIVVALVRKNQVSLALSIFLKLLNSPTVGDSIVIPDAIACNELLVGLKKSGMKDEFKEVFEKLRGTKLYPLDRWGYNICIHTLGCWGDLSIALSLFKEMKGKSGSFDPDLCTYNSLIHVLCSLGKVKDALAVWEELKSSSGHEPDSYTYRILIQGFCKSYRINDALKIFSEMQYNGVRAETVVYNSLLDGLLKSRKLNEACNLFEKMVDDDGVRASCWTYNILIDGLLKNGRPEAAYTLFSDLKKKSNNFVDSVSYSIVILHLCREAKLEEALKLVEEMEARGFVVDLVTITSLLTALYRRGLWDLTEKLMRKHIRDGNLVLSILKWKSAMEGSLKSPQRKEKDLTPIFPSTNDIADFLSLPKLDSGKIKDFEQPGNIEIDEWSSSPYMDMLANKFTSGDQSPVKAFTMSRGVRVMDKGEDSFDIDMVNTYLSIFLSKGKLSLACKLFELFTSMGVDPVSYTYNSIMSSFVKKGYFREAWAVLDAMGETLNPADIATYNIIIQGLGKMGRADLASAVLEKLTREGGYLDVVMYNTLINALGKAGRVDEADKFFGQMKAGGINPDVVTYNTLIEVHAKAGRVEDAYKVLRMMLDAGCAPNHVTDTILDFLESEIERLRYEKAFVVRSSTDDPS